MVPPNVPNRSKGKRAGAHGLGRYQEALAAAERVAEDPRGLGLWIRDLFELIEAAVRSGQPERATGPLAKLGEIAHAAGTDWALGSYARSAALLAEGETAERLYREAIERFSRTRGSESLARASPLRRMAAARAPPRRRPRAATSRLRDARGRGMEAFAERARRELLATGETARKRTVETLDELTPQERQVARLAAGGQTNPEIGAQLFLSPRTVEWHLSKVFSKLGISSRKVAQLGVIRRRRNRRIRLTVSGRARDPARRRRIRLTARGSTGVSTKSSPT